MAVVLPSAESELGKELAKWEQHHTPYVALGLNPGNRYQFRPFPKMLYRAVKKDTGKVVCMEGPPPIHQFKEQVEYQFALAKAEALERQCHTVVNSEDELRIAVGQGWVDGSPLDALHAYELREQALADDAARAAFQAKRMSPEAQAELAAAHDDTMAHVVDVVPARRGRPRAANAEEA